MTTPNPDLLAAADRTIGDNWCDEWRVQDREALIKEVAAFAQAQIDKAMEAQREALCVAISKVQNELARGCVEGFEPDGPHYKNWNGLLKKLEAAIRAAGKEQGNE